MLSRYHNYKVFLAMSKTLCFVCCDLPHLLLSLLQDQIVCIGCSLVLATRACSSTAIVFKVVHSTCDVLLEA